MDKYLIWLLFDGPIKEDICESFGRCLAAQSWKCPRTSIVHRGQTFVNTIHVSHSFKTLNSLEWTKLPNVGEEDVAVFLKKHSQDQYEMAKNTNEEDILLSDVIHSLADKLPDTGYYINVLWIVGNYQLPDISDHVDIYGALKRITEWHRGQITYLVSDDEKSNFATSPWVTFLHSIVKDPTENLMENFVWCGRINVTEQKTKASLTLPGFVMTSPAEDLDREDSSLMSKLFTKSPSPRKAFSVRKSRHEKVTQQQEGICLSSRMEYLEELPYLHVPSFFVTSIKLELSLMVLKSAETSPVETKSEVLYRHILQNKKMCSIVRLWFSPNQPKYQPVKHLGPDGKEKSGTEIWKEKLLQNEITMPEQPLTGPLDYYTFMLRPGDNGRISAYLLRQPREINGGVIEILMKCPQPLPSDEKTRKNIFKILQDLPSMSSEVVTQINDEVFRLQKIALQKWIDHQEEKGKPCKLTEKELYHLLNTVRESYIQKVQESGVYERTRLKDVSNITLESTTSELDIDPNEWLERFALQEKDNTEKLQRVRSMDRMGGVPPPPKETEDESLKLDAAQFLKLFAPTGAPLAECLSPIRCPNARSRVKLPKYNSAEVKDAEWPECTKYSYHGVYYNASSASEQAESRYGRIRDRYIYHETSSTCTLEQKAKLTTMAMLTCISSKPRDRSDSSKLQRKGSSGDFNKEPKPPLKRPAADKNEEALPAGKRRRSPRQTKPVNKTAEPTKVSTRSEDSQKIKPSVKPVDNVDGEKPVEKRSERHKRKLQSIVTDVLTKNGMPVDNPAHKTCSERLFRVTKAFIMDLKSSHNLAGEMRKIAEDQVEMVINFELKKLRKSETK